MASTEAPTGDDGTGQTDSRGATPDDRASQAYDRLRTLIVRGQLAPGSRIVESEVATRLGVSRTPIRSALQRLQQEGYVRADDTGKQTRMTVAPLTLKDARELFDIVAQLEGLAARAAAVLDDDERSVLVDALRELNDALAVAAGQQPMAHAAMFDLDERFHYRYVRAGAGPRLLSLYRAMKPQADRYIHGYIGALSGELEVTVEEHRRIVEAIEGGGASDAEEAVKENWHNARDRLLQIIGALGQRGHW